jgi:hypothetical protein
MKPTLRDKLAKLHESAKALHEETDALNALYKQVESSLQGVGVTFWWDAERFDVKAGNAEEYEAYVIVGYAKLGDQWCLATKYVQHEPETAEKIEAFEPISLTRTTRDVRVEFAPRIEDFVDALIAEVAKTRTAVESAKDHVARHIGGAK